MPSAILKGAVKIFWCACGQQEIVTRYAMINTIKKCIINFLKEKSELIIFFNKKISINTKSKTGSNVIIKGILIPIPKPIVKVGKFQISSFF